MGKGSGYRRLRSTFIESLEERIAPATFVVINLNDAGPGSLRDAVDRANAAPGVDTIVFKGAATSGEIALTSGEIDITDSVNIRGPGAGRLTIDAQDLSRIFNIDDGTAAVKRVTISGLAMVDGNSGVENGGGIFSSESLTLMNSVVSGCRATDLNSNGGGVYAATDGQLIIRNSKNTGNQAVRGGGVSLTAASGIQIIGSTISGNTAFGPGGGVYALIGGDGSGSILISGSTIANNTGDRGGGIFADNDATGVGASGRIILRDTVVSGNRTPAGSPDASLEGGGVYIVDGNVRIERSPIINTSAVDRGGGLRTESVESLTIKNSRILNNHITSLTGTGGGVYIEGGQSVTFQNAVISSNASSGDGGGVFAIRSDLTLRSSTVSGNTADISGGGIYVSQGSLALDRATIRDNVAGATDVVDGAGGGVYARQGTVAIDRSTVRDNWSGAHGGGIATAGIGDESTDLRISNSLFTQNHASNSGGGVDTRSDGSILIVSSRFIENSASVDGGGLYLRSSTGTISIRNSLIAQNTAWGEGGGMAVFKGGTIPISVVNTVISGNAGDFGGGVMLVGGTLNLQSSTVTDNVAASQGGGILIGPLGGGTVTLNGSRVTGNIAPTGPQIHGPVLS